MRTAKPSKIGSLALSRRIQAAQGTLSCDLVIANVNFLDVFSCQFRVGDVGVIDGTIVALDPGIKGHRRIDGKGKWLVPGFIDAHVHIESSLMTPDHFESAVLPRGTTMVFCDPHEITNVIGVNGIKYFLQASEKLSLDVRVLLSSCVPATPHLETNGAGRLTASHLRPFASHAKVAGLAEVMDVPGVLARQRDMLDKLLLAPGKRIDGHCPLVRGAALSACAAAGISSCHESSEIEEAREKLTKGIAVWIREGSVARDLQALAPLLTMATSPYMGFCTDDRNPYDITTEGHIDHLVRTAIRYGVEPEVAYRSASQSVARHYGLVNVGAIAPGYVADLVLLDDMETCQICSVFKTGKLASELDTPHLPIKNRNTVLARVPELADLKGPEGKVHVIDVTPGKIITGRAVLNSDDRQVARLTVLERHGHRLKPANGYVRGFGTDFNGAIASSVGHDSHNLIVVGKDPADMRVALAALIDSHGGFCVVQHGSVLAHLPLPFCGVMSHKEPRELEKELRALREAGRAIGCTLPEPFLQLAFLSLPVIPSLKLTDKGLVDVDAFRLIDVRAS